ncbi:MAG: molybdate ABC transporter substrate-binding protein [Sulfurovum sp.]|nr:molybdate ABC transporter substrate-binding protein [Sulfurovum sp.]
MYKLILVSWLLLSVTYGETIYIALAANMGEAIKALVTKFEQQYPQIHVKYTIGGSGKLATQIANGAPFDLFLSANMDYPKKLYEEGHTVGVPIVYAQGTLVLFSIKPKEMKKNLQLLTSPSVSHIAIANPKTAPYGVAAVEALKNTKLYDTLYSKLVYGESIAQTLTYVLHGADVGIVAKSSLFSPQMKHFKEGVNWIDVPTKLHTPISQGMVLLKRATNHSQAKLFFTFMQSTDAKKILTQYGYHVL